VQKGGKLEQVALITGDISGIGPVYADAFII